MDGTAPGSAFVGNFVLVLAVRQLLVYLLWVLAAAFAGAGACWCCGYGAQAAWARAEAGRRAWRAARGVEPPEQDAISLEAARGICAIEEYLAVRSVALPRPERIDEDEAG
jgi:hypothetical protein